MITAFVGAGLNVLLNLLLIPRLDAMGASIATFASYFGVCILRLITAGRLIAFQKEWGRCIVNTLLLSGMTAVVTLTSVFAEATAWLWIAAVVIFGLMILYNFRPIWGLGKDAKRMTTGK